MYTLLYTNTNTVERGTHLFSRRVYFKAVPLLTHTDHERARRAFFSIPLPPLIAVKLCHNGQCAMGEARARRNESRNLPALKILDRTI